MKLYIKCLLFILATSTIFSQNTLKGIVIDTDTEDPIVFANIYFPKLEKGTTSNEDGTFTIENLPNGTYSLIISILGYETLSLEINIPEQNYIEARMYSTIIEMNEVILSTPFHKLQSDNVMKVEQKKVSELRSNGAINLSQGITNIQGVESYSTGISIGKPVIRGLSGNRVLVYTQGVRLENQQFGSEHGLGINDAGIESVEVIKGPASLLYGSDALGGVLYLNPERFADNNTVNVNGGFNYFTNTQGINTNIGLKQSFNKFKYILRGSFTEHADYKSKDYRVTNTRFNEKDLKTALGYNTTNFNTELRYNYNSSKLGIPEEIGEQSTNRGPLLPFQDIDNHIISSKSKLILENSSFDLNFGYTLNNRKEFEEHHHEEEETTEEHEEALEPALDMKLSTFSYDLKYNLPELGRFETIIGIQGMNQKNANYGEEELIPDATTYDFGLLATSHIHYTNLDLQLGLRFDNRKIDVTNGIDRTFNSFNIATGLKTNVFKTLTTRLNIATGFRAPNLAELTSDGSHEGTNRYEIGDPDLSHERNVQLDLSLEHQSQHLEIYANVFFNSVKDYIYLTPTGAFVEDDPVFLYVQNDAKLYGGEFGIHIHPHPLDWLHLELGYETVTGTLSNDSNLPLIPANKFNNTLRIEFEGKTITKGNAYVSLNTILDQNNISEFETRTGGYSIFGAGVSGTVEVFGNELDLTIAANNLTNKSYISHLSRLKPDGIYNIGRNISFGINYTL